jgi:flagellar biosynthetic protein FliR
VTALLPIDVGVFLALFCRAAGFAFAAPVLGDKTLPARIRVALAAVLALVFSALHSDGETDVTAYSVPLEVAFGLACGFAARLVLAAGEIAGELIGIHMGMGFAAAYDPALGENALVMRRLAHTLGGLAFVLAGGVEATAHLVSLPPASPMTVGAMVVGAIARSGDIFTVGVRLATPLVVAVFTANIALGLASRAAPALNVFSVMLAATATMGGIILFATAPEFARTIEELGHRAVGIASGRILP